MKADLTKGRGWFYAVGFGWFLALCAMAAANTGYGTYEGGYYDPPPIDVKWLASWIISGVGNGVAALAVWRGWGRK